MDVVSDAIGVVQLGHPWSHRVRTSGGWCAREERYQGAGFYVVLKGTYWLLTDGASTLLQLGVGDAVLLPHGNGHVLADFPVDPAVAQREAVPLERLLTQTETSGRFDGVETEILCAKYWLDWSRMHPLMTELPEVVHLPQRIGSHPELSAAVDLLAGELDKKKPGSCIALPNLLDLLFIYILRSWMAEATCGSWPGALGDPVTSAALRAIHNSPAAQWSNDRLAAEAGVSRPTLARRFTALVGRPPMAYLTWWRLILAATLLRTTHATLAAVATQVGYGSPYALSHAFEREFGTTPGRYRTQATSRSADAEPVRS